MTVLTEGNLQITIADAVNARKFDGNDHGLSHCMKAVDFVVELTDRYLFIEVKDPQAPQTPDDRLKDFVCRFQSGRIDRDFFYKYRDSFLYEWASGRANKPIDYFMLIAVDSLTDAHLLSRQRALEGKLPILGPSSRPWKRPIVRGCGVFNISSWNKILPDYPVSRLTP